MATIRISVEADDGEIVVSRNKKMKELKKEAWRN